MHRCRCRWPAQRTTLGARRRRVWRGRPARMPSAGACGRLSELHAWQRLWLERTLKASDGSSKAHLLPLRDVSPYCGTRAAMIKHAPTNRRPDAACSLDGPRCSISHLAPGAMRDEASRASPTATAGLVQARCRRHCLSPAYEKAPSSVAPFWRMLAPSCRNRCPCFDWPAQCLPSAALPFIRRAPSTAPTLPLPPFPLYRFCQPRLQFHQSHAVQRRRHRSNCA
jgi:hypothetical protein